MVCYAVGCGARRIRPIRAEHVTATAVRHLNTIRSVGRRRLLRYSQHRTSNMRRRIETCERG